MTKEHDRIVDAAIDKAADDIGKGIDIDHAVDQAVDTIVAQPQLMRAAAVKMIRDLITGKWKPKVSGARIVRSEELLRRLGLDK